MKKLIQLIYKNITTILEDLQSWRNKLVLFTGIMCLIALQTKDPTIVSVVFGCWTVILTYYFHLRQKSYETEVKNGKKEEVKSGDVKGSD
jgi:flagellar biosynthesis component FlhA